MTLDRRDFLAKALAGSAGAAALAACGAGSDGSAAAAGAEAVGSGPQIAWRLATSFPRSLDIIHGSAELIAKRVSALTGGRFTMRVFAGGEIVPPLQVMDGVQAGTIHCGLSPGYYYIGKSPALAFDTALPFGLSTRQQIAWLMHGGGLDLMNEIYARFGIVTFPCMSTGGQMGGWFRRQVGTLADLKGLRMRIPGIGGEIMSRLGVTVQVLGAADIYPALERGAIDATEFVGSYDDEKLGFYQAAKYYYYPGWWEPGVTSPMMINVAAYKQLPPPYQAALQVACTEALTDSLARYDAQSPPAMQRLVRDHGVMLREFSTEIMEAAWKQSNAYFDEQAAKDADFKKVHENWRAFRARAFPYFAGNELSYAAFAFPKLGSVSTG